MLESAYRVQQEVVVRDVCVVARRRRGAGDGGAHGCVIVEEQFPYSLNVEDAQEQGRAGGEGRQSAGDVYRYWEELGGGL